jgi:hypothetical protein
MTDEELAKQLSETDQLAKRLDSLILEFGNTMPGSGTFYLNYDLFTACQKRRWNTYRGFQIKQTAACEERTGVRDKNYVKPKKR